MDLLFRPSSIAAALFSLAQTTKVKPNCLLYFSLSLLNLLFSSAVSSSSPACLCSLETF